MELCFATNNPNKLNEVSAALGDAFTLRTLQDIGCTDELPETSGTIAGNSRQKAEYIWKHFGVSCFADDSGLEIDALDGRPGVDSAYYSGSRDAAQNIQRVLTELQGQTNRKARFITVFTLILHGVEHQFEGIFEGTIIDAPRGTGGFGYDPIFLPDGADRTLAELTMAEKTAISHRSRALAKMVAYLREQAS
ncbi:RdgB/HAM1 family non-canonical purine NTP pyrophosphatase [Spirosoma sordidisoli]|uniref:dITP/XTP pyrophosphatase n=1 Tax=Spirosoma sordidisoli TaxID=2502893 RepID=A0A4Q2UIX9_9BACT|nr:RdgB/HAM1 family non-canonical purine NTP pyrophosphatase [Spirosoma sordidisoli]RYC69154.1 RdgB/HAM1 family non-canonical purine NTP pyrophosphatase [Spirosoma sordidisoli]